MKMQYPACAICMAVLVSIAGPSTATETSETALANCRDEAVSTGLEDQADITEYVDLCMQAWQNPAEYTEWNPETGETDESSIESRPGLAD